MSRERHGNRQKHLNPNPIQRALLNRFHCQIYALVQQTGATRLLDTGCGEGFVIRYLQQHQPSLTMVGGDYSGEALVWGQTELEHNVPLANLDIHRLPFPDASFPLTLCLEVLEHLPDSTAGLSELARVSSEYVLLSVPHEPYFRIANFLRGKKLLTFGNDPEHLQHYSGRGFRHMAGRIIDIVWHGYAFPWQILLGRKRL